MEREIVPHARSGSHAFGTQIGSFQANRFNLAEMWAELELAQLASDRQAEALNAPAS